ncbi:hypothetical protein [Mesorhizobium sp.]|uniref:hypothetical protein n=1 Tax=Mesorhizobium sp. TaxID=1871066 RepID=UPI0025BCC222|nr:hypothetical protein [Mesorhizobium sp.]
MKGIVLILLIFELLTRAAITLGASLGLPDDILNILEKCQHFVDVIHTLLEVCTHFLF